MCEHGIREPKRVPIQFQTTEDANVCSELLTLTNTWANDTRQSHECISFRMAVLNW